MCARCGGSAASHNASDLPNVCENDLPIHMRDVLDAARASRPDREVTCIAFHTLDGTGRNVRLEPSPQLIDDWTASAIAARLRPKELLVLSVTVTETTFDNSRTLTHVLVAKMVIAPSRQWLSRSERAD
jgi:hypothetical protein